MSKIAALILAAGASRRLGRPKQLLKLAGRTLLRRTAELALSLGAGPVAVVLGAHVEEMRPELEGLDVQIVHNPDWERGMSTSLRAGIRFLESREPEVTGVLILLVDQPRVDEALLRRLLETFRQAQPLLVVSRYNGANGVPAVFHCSLFGELQSVEGDRGARRVIGRHESELIAIDFPGGVEDIDTEEDAGFWMPDG